MIISKEKREKDTLFVFYTHVLLKSLENQMDKLNDF